MNIPVLRTIDGAATDFGLLQGILGYCYLIDWAMSKALYVMHLARIPMATCRRRASSLSPVLAKALRD
jgi:hypothetical protein